MGMDPPTHVSWQGGERGDNKMWVSPTAPTLGCAPDRLQSLVSKYPFSFLYAFVLQFSLQNPTLWKLFNCSKGSRRA